MSQRCPVCRARIWTDPLLTPGRLCCPRCGVVFRPTVPWVYFRVLLLAVVACALILIISFSQTHFWMLLFLVGLIILFWFLPRVIDLQRISGELTIPEGPMDVEHLKLQVEDEDWRQKQDKFEEELDFRQWVYILLVVILLFLVVASVTQGF